MKRTRKEAVDLFDIWMQEMNRGRSGTDYLQGCLQLAEWLEAGYQRAMTYKNRHDWLKAVCGYCQGHQPKPMD